MRRKGFTLVELLVVIAIIALLMGILMPSLARVRVIANRMVCGSHLGGIGKSVLMYASDYQNKYPLGGLFNSTWSPTGQIAQWDAKERKEAFAGNRATVTSCFYLLVRLGDAMPKQFVCPGDKDAKEFDLSQYKTTIRELSEAWDFGENPGIHVSYSMNDPFSEFVTDTSSGSGNPLGGDRNPYLDTNAKNYVTGGRGAAPSFVDNEYHDQDLTGNAAAHERKAQNILYNDGHVSAEPYPNCGYNYDNVWKYWGKTKPDVVEMQVGGVAPKQGVAAPKSKDDTCLINDKNDYEG
jgi:prepilin-type N-terminal cleavage/methylation domain-containing protein